MITANLLMTGCRYLGLLSLGCLLSSPVHAETTIVTERDVAGAGFHFKSIPLPDNNDAATGAEFSLVDGEMDRNGGGLDVLHDGRVPAGEDSPRENFFFRAGADGGRILVDLKQKVNISQINTFSWHAGARGPQVYTVYGANAGDAGLELKPKRGASPDKAGWRLLAKVDTRPGDSEFGGQYAVSIRDSAGKSVGEYQYLLFDISRTESGDAFGNSFFSEIDVVDLNGPALASHISAAAKKALVDFASEGAKFQFTVDVSLAADLQPWVEKELKPVIQTWYPKLVAMLPSDGYAAPAKVNFRFRTDMGVLPASAAGNQVNLNVNWFRKELKREALGSVVHEMVHIVQAYHRAKGGHRTPGWIVEGIPDYIRWFLYEPQSKGADITAGNLSNAKYDASYRITGNFLNWATQTYDRDLVRKLNAIARNGDYTEQFWKEQTGKSVQELSEEWKKAQAARIEQNSKGK